MYVQEPNMRTREGEREKGEGGGERERERERERELCIKIYIFYLYISRQYPAIWTESCKSQVNVLLLASGPIFHSNNPRRRMLSEKEQQIQKLQHVQMALKMEAQDKPAVNQEVSDCHPLAD